MSFAGTVTVKNPSEDYTKLIFNELRNLSDDGQSSYKCEDEVINRLHNLITEYRELREDAILHFQSIWNKSTVEEREFLFHGVLGYLFENYINLYRVIVAFMYIIEVLRMSQQEYKKYYDWSVVFVLTRVHPWVEEHGGWEYQSEIICLWDENSYELSDFVKLYPDLVEPIKHHGYIHSIIFELMMLSDIGRCSYSPDTFEYKVINRLHNLIIEDRERRNDTISHFQSIWNRSTFYERKSLFHWVLEYMFIDGINWSRVIVTFIFIIEVLRMSSYEERKKYYPWSFMFVLSRVHPWVEEHGGYGETFVD